MRREALDILYMGTLPPHPGGSATVGAQLLVGLARLGHSVRALAPITAEALRAGAHFAARHPEVSVAWFDVPFFEISPGTGTPEAYRKREGDGVTARFPSLVAERRPDVVLIGRESFAWHVPDLAEACSLPSVLVFHYGNPVGMLGTLDPAMAEWLVGRFRSVDLGIPVARHLAWSVQQLGLRNVRTIPNGVDLRRFSPRLRDAALLQRLNLGDGWIIVVHASNLKKVKRPLDIVDSAAQVLRRNPKLAYVIVGDGPSRAVMEERCRRNKILENFRFVGWVEHERLPAYLNLADMVVMPSETEGLAMVYLEAQACGRLLLASDIPAAREVVRDGETGLLFRKGNVGDLAAQTLRAAGDPELRAAIGTRAREWVRTHHDLDRTVAAYEDALRKVAGRPRR